MILRMPTYCKNFKCIADKCSDNCCIGWEIDIDPATAEYYNSVGGAFGDRLKNEINYGEVCSFKLRDERCSFLGGKNLCDIILNLGEDKLCQICRDHPRYFEWYSDVKEGGVGLCCEEGARLILSAQGNFSTYDITCDDEGDDEYDEALYDYLLFARGEIIRLLEDDSIPLRARLSRVMSFAQRIQENADNYRFDSREFERDDPLYEWDIKAIVKFFGTLEVIDDRWKDYLKNLTTDIDTVEKQIRDSDIADPTISRYLQNIAVYFTWRYFMKGVFDGEILSKVWLMLVSVLFIQAMFVHAHNEDRELTLTLCSELAKNYSKETEYSSENLEAIFSSCHEQL